MSASKTFWKFDAVVTALAVESQSRRAAVGLGDGTVRLIDLDRQIAGKAETLRLHEGPVLALCAGFDGFVSAGDDGTVRSFEVNKPNTNRILLNQKGKWFEQLCPTPDGRMAASAGRQIFLISLDGTFSTLGPHPSTVAALSSGWTGLGTPTGPVVAAAHYGGVTLWPLTEGEPRLFAWKGSHLAVALSPDGRYLASALQDGEVHAWRLGEDTDMRMAGYPGKITSIAWTADSLLLATGGAEIIACWPFDGPGPEGRPPFEFGTEVSARVRLVAAHPFLPMIAAGFEDGVVAMVDLPTGRVGRVELSKKAPASALLWSPDGVHLLSGAEDGRVAIFTAPGLRDAKPESTPAS